MVTKFPTQMYGSGQQASLVQSGGVSATPLSRGGPEAASCRERRGDLGARQTGSSAAALWSSSAASGTEPLGASVPSSLGSDRTRWGSAADEARRGNAPVPLPSRPRTRERPRARHRGGHGVFAELNVTGTCTRGPPVPGEAGVVLWKPREPELSGPVGSRGVRGPRGSGAVGRGARRAAGRPRVTAARSGVFAGPRGGGVLTSRVHVLGRAVAGAVAEPWPEPRASRLPTSGGAVSSPRAGALSTGCDPAAAAQSEARWRGSGIRFCPDRIPAPLQRGNGLCQWDKDENDLELDFTRFSLQTEAASEVSRAVCLEHFGTGGRSRSFRPASTC